MYAVEGYVAQARFGAANLHVFAFAFVAFKRNAGHTSQGIRDISVRQTGDDLGWQHLNDVFGVLRTIEGLDFAALAFAAYDNLLILRLNLQHCVRLDGISRDNRNRRRERRESYIRNS